MLSVGYHGAGSLRAPLERRPGGNPLLQVSKKVLMLQVTMVMRICLARRDNVPKYFFFLGFHTYNFMSHKIGVKRSESPKRHVLPCSTKRVPNSCVNLAIPRPSVLQPALRLS